MPLSRAFVLSLTILTFSGCATYQHQPISAASTQAQFEARSLASAGVREFLAKHDQAAAEEWDLLRLTLAAFYFSPELDVARAEMMEAEAGIRTAEARPNPVIRFSPTYNDDTPASLTPWILGYALDVPIETGGKRAHRTAEARHRAEAARLRVASGAWAVRSAVRRALTDLHAAEATADLWRGQRPLLGDAARIVTAQVEAGDISPLYAAQARVAFNRAELAARESERAVGIAQSQLAQAIGVPLMALKDVRLSYRGLAEVSPPANAADVRSWAAQNRADLLAELAAYAATEAALRGEVARQYPNLSFGPGYELDQGQGKWSLGVGFTLPIFHQNQGPIAGAKARREIAAARFLSLQSRVLAEVDRASADHQAALADLEVVKTMRESLERQGRTVQAQQAAGETSRLDLVRAQIELADNTRAELEARVRATRALGALEDAVQRPIDWTDSVWRSNPRSAAQ